MRHLRPESLAGLGIIPRCLGGTDSARGRSRGDRSGWWQRIAIQHRSSVLDRNVISQGHAPVKCRSHLRAQSRPRWGTWWLSLSL